MARRPGAARGNLAGLTSLLSCFKGFNEIFIVLAWRSFTAAGGITGLSVVVSEAQQGLQAHVLYAALWDDS